MKILTRSLASALLLAASPAFPTYPAPDPVTIPVDANLKFDSGTLESVDEAQHLMVVKSGAGLVTFHIDRVSVIGPDHRPRTLSSISVGQQVYVWYHVDNGAIAAEIDLPSPPPKS